LGKERKHYRTLPFVTQYHPAVPNLKKIIASKWLLIENQPTIAKGNLSNNHQ